MISNKGARRTQGKNHKGEIEGSCSVISSADTKELRHHSIKVSKFSKNFKAPFRVAVEIGVSLCFLLNFVLKMSLVCMLSIPEKSRVVKQKHSVDRKRGDRRNLKAPMKAKFESFFSESLSSNSAAGGNKILGIYGLKSGIHDVTKHADELSLNELLDDSYKCPILCQEKGKKATNTNENILHSVRKACSILQLQRPIHSQNAEGELVSRGKSGTLDLTEKVEHTRVTCNAVPLYVDNPCAIVDSCSKPKAPANMKNSLLLQPKDILERLALPPAKDLDSLLQDTTKPAVFARNTPDLCSGKTMSHGARLPPFPWSYSFGGPCKTNIDSGKLSTNRSTCQGRWVRIQSIASSFGGASSCFSDLDSLTFDQSLVPSGGLKSGLSENVKGPCTPVRLPRWEQVSSSPGKTMLKGRNPGGGTNNSCYPPFSCAIEGHSPRLLAAAQTLYEIASHSTKQNQNSGMIKWPKKPSQKATKARKSSSSRVKVESISATPKSEMGPGDPGLDDTTNVIRGTIKWSTPTSSRSSPCKLDSYSVTNTKQSNGNIVKLLGMMPSTTMLVDKTCNSQQKGRNPWPMNWGRSKKE
ncbi:hypothetical protein HHK36_001224 [Tetracentron sinense]|uniref:Uncharacterized protein n=1 Tax=Tetracentron sinense TaxID=13715 RepID=A0A835DQW1_TETSI|nr:hypothetical protein HHK36_001224 [Tetracentron sinense]